MSERCLLFFCFRLAPSLVHGWDVHLLELPCFPALLDPAESICFSVFACGSVCSKPVSKGEKADLGSLLGRLNQLSELDQDPPPGASYKQGMDLL